MDALSSKASITKGTALATTKHKSGKGKQHPVHAASFARVAKEIRAIMKRRLPYQSQPTLVTAGDLAKIFEKEAKRLRTIVR
jgi:hypothetical protein